VPFDKIRAQFDNDHEVVARIEASMPPGAAIYQMPYLPFPEAGLTYHRMLDYDHFKAYLHSRSLRWSYGAMRGREGDLWLRTIDGMPLEQQIDSIAQAGFSGIYLDRFGYDDAEDEKGLRKALGEPTVVSRDGRYAFYDLRARVASLQRGLSDGAWMERQKRALDDPRKLFLSTDLPKMLPGKVLPGHVGNIDVLSSAKAHLSGQFLVAGWAIDERRSTPAHGVAVFEGTRLIEYLPHTGERRDDVANARHAPTARDSGWRLRMRARAIGLGKHQIGFYAVLADGSLAAIPYHGHQAVEIDIE
jgi:hypothetical protein